MLVICTHSLVPLLWPITLFCLSPLPGSCRCSFLRLTLLCSATSGPPLNGGTMPQHIIMVCLTACALPQTPLAQAVSLSMAWILHLSLPRTSYSHWPGSMSVYWPKLNHKHNAMEKKDIRMKEGSTEQVTLELGLKKWKVRKHEQPKATGASEWIASQRWGNSSNII